MIGCSFHFRFWMILRTIPVTGELVDRSAGEEGEMSKERRHQRFMYFLELLMWQGSKLNTMGPWAIIYELMVVDWMSIGACNQDAKQNSCWKAWDALNPISGNQKWIVLIFAIDRYDTVVLGFLWAPGLVFWERWTIWHESDEHCNLLKLCLEQMLLLLGGTLT